MLHLQYSGLQCGKIPGWPVDKRKELDMSTPKYVTHCVEHFLEYVKYDTQSREDSDTFPSTPGQLVLLQRLQDDLKAQGLEDVSIYKHGYVFATDPSTSVKPDVPVIGFLAH